MVKKYRFFFICNNCTVQIFHDFSITHILREIKYGGSRSSKNAVFAIFGALDFIDLVDIGL